MVQLNILRYPDPRLQTVAQPVTAIDARIGRLVDDMLETMYAADGIGLAATQVDVHEQVIVIDVSESHDQPLVLINPQITWRSEEMAFAEEGCLSVPAVYDQVQRHARVKVQALGRDAQPFELEAADLLAVCVQHEIDHLLGKVFVDYLSQLKRSRIRTRLLKREREARRGA